MLYHQLVRYRFSFIPGLLVLFLIITMTSSALAAEPVSRTAESISQDPGQTGGVLSYNFDPVHSNLTISNGCIEWYPAKEGFPPQAGNWLGVAVQAPDGFSGDIKSLQIDGKAYEAPFLSPEEQNRKELWYYFQAQAGDSQIPHVLNIEWSEEYFPEKITISTRDLTLSTGVAAYWQETGNIISTESVNYLELELYDELNQQKIKLDSDNVKNISVSRDGRESIAINPEGEELLFELDHEDGKYIYTVIDNKDMHYEAAIDWQEAKAIPRKGQTVKDEKGDSYLEYILSGLDLSSFDCMYTINPDGTTVKDTFNRDSSLWFKVGDGSDSNWIQQEGDYSFIIKKDGIWYHSLVFYSTRELVLLSKEPSGEEDSWVDNEDLYSEIISEIDQSKRYFIRLCFEDQDGSLELMDGALDRIKLSRICSRGGSQMSLLDTELFDYIDRLESEAERDQFINNYILVKDTANKTAYLNIPVKALRTQTSYIVYLNPGMLHYRGGPGNEAISWEFITMSVPAVTGVSIGTVGEDYDEDDPIIINGDGFNLNGTIQVEFNGIAAHEVKVKKGLDDKHYLEVYLPAGSKRLEPGSYDITVINGDHHKQTLYGDFSVIEASEHEVPRDGERVKQSSREGDIVEDIFVSADTLNLNSRYTDKNHVELDLDELMGEEVLIRKISYKGYRKDRIGQLEIFSKWADISLYDLRLDSSEKKDDIEICLGRTSPQLSQSLRRQLYGYAIKSEFIEVGGENYSVSAIDVTIPFKYSDGRELKALRYDENFRRWAQVDFKIDWVNRTASIYNTLPGIFVLAE